MSQAIPEWKKLETKLQDYFEARAEREFITYQRFMDTHAAGAFLPANPGDHLVIAHGKPLLIETKYSSAHASLASCFASHVSDSQLMFHRLWSRAGARTFILFKGKNSIYELWDGGHCAWVRANGKRLSGSEPIKKIENFTWFGAFTELFEPLVITELYSFRQVRIL